VISVFESLALTIVEPCLINCLVISASNSALFCFRECSKIQDGQHYRTVQHSITLEKTTNFISWKQWSTNEHHILFATWTYVETMILPWYYFRSYFDKSTIATKTIWLSNLLTLSVLDEGFQNIYAFYYCMWQQTA
jgi:hypothetical protein